MDMPPVKQIEIRPYYSDIGANSTKTSGQFVTSTMPDFFIHEFYKNIEQRFQELAQKWVSETVASSSPLDKIANDNYLEIINMGGANRDVIVPLILKELQKKSDFWFKALKTITKENPVKPEEFNSYKLVTKAWLRWGKEQGYL